MLVIGGQALSEQARLHSHDRIVSGVVIGGAVEDLKAERILLQTRGSSGNRLLHDVAEERTELVRLSQPPGFEDPLEFFMDRGNV
ncbi:MAG TPA: hypothetical protein PLF84_19995 [Bryobacteraceae bacterium]|nr:hypothetical protein [Bryobacteraceae bacterium]